VTDLDELVGLWDSGPYAYGSMESAELALLPDRTGWSTWSSFGGGMELIRLRWRRLGTAVISIREIELTSGTWEPGRPDCIISDQPPRPLDEETRLRYELVRETPPLASAPMKSIKLDRPFMFAYAYALTRPDVVAADMPAVVS
jgi:hypothetical protein